MNQDQQKNLYLLLDSRNTPLARGIRESPADAPSWQLRILEDKISDVMEHEEIQMIPLTGNGTAILGKILRNRNDSIVVERLKTSCSAKRENLRMPTHFKSFAYPLTGSWKGRVEIEGNDLSCGGLSFFCGRSLQEGERVEAVVPITSQPLILRCEIIRQRPTDREGQDLYACKFVDMCYDEEMMVREAVFNVQLQSRPKAEGSAGA